MGLNFPSSPTDGQRFFDLVPYGTSPVFQWSAAKSRWGRNAGTAMKTNKLVNGSMQVSQQWGDAALVCLTGIQYYAADQWRADFNMNAATQITCQRLAGVTPRGSKYRFYLSVTVAQAAIAAGEYVLIRQFVEGNRLADLNWGTAAAQWAVLRFGFRGPAGTYTVALRNAAAGAANRCLVVPFTVSAADNNWDQEYSFAIPPCFDGTWAIDNTQGIEVMLAVAAGSQYYGSATFAWQSGGSQWTASTITNNINTVGRQFMLFDVALYADPLATGVAPEFQGRNYEEILQDCLRYWYRCTHARGFTVSATGCWVYQPHYVPMRVNPATALVGTGLRVHDGLMANPLTSVDASGSTTEVFGIGATFSAGGGGVGRFNNVLSDATEANYIAVSARF